MTGCDQTEDGLLFLTTQQALFISNISMPVATHRISKAFKKKVQINNKSVGMNKEEVV